MLTIKVILQFGVNLINKEKIIDEFQKCVFLDKKYIGYGSMLILTQFLI